MSSPRVTSASIEALVFDFLVAATDEILQERRGICNPITHSSASFKDNSDYCKQSLLSWRRDITTPLILDLYIFDPRINKHILMERWKFLYQRANDLKDTSQLLLINHRVGTLLRSLHSFVRLLPGFNLINISQKLPTLSFQLYEQKNTYPTGFVSDISRYNFDPISTSKGLLYMSVKFMTQPFVKDILVNVNGGSGHSRRNSRTAEENSSSAAIPIPSKDSHNTDTGGAYHGGKHMNARTITPSTSFDPTAENSSAESTGTLGSASGGVSGSTPPLGNRYGRTSSRDRELHRRSFQLPSHAENDENSGGTGVANASFPPQPQSQHAGSLDSYSGSNTQQYMIHHSTDGHHHNQPTSGRVQSLKLTSQNFAGAPDGTGYGIQITNSQGTTTTTGGTSYGNSYSLTSTPPFSLSELAAQQTERYGRTTSGSGGVVAGSNPESSQSALSGASPPNPPFPAFSCSLTSTSPHMGGNMLAWLDKHGQGDVQGQQGGGCGALQAYEMHHRMHHARSGSEDSRSYFLANAAARGDRLSPASGLDFSELKLKIAPLPCSPFLSTSQYREGGEMSGSHSTALVRGGGSSTSHYTHGRSNSIGSAGAGSTKSEPIPSSGRQLQHSQDEEDNTLDSVRMHESQRMSLDNADSSDFYAFRNSLGSESEGRVPSKDRHSDGTDPDLEHCLDVELPFAWAESDMAGNAVPRPASVTGDSLGAQLVYGLSKMSLSSSPFTETSNNNAQLTTEQAQSYHNNNTNTGTREGYSPSNRTSSSAGGGSSYTGAGLSGELLGKINEYKNFNTTFTK